MSGSAASVEEVFYLFADHASDPYDEAVSQLDHAVQTAALARADEASDPLVAAALLHDVGHLLSLRDDIGVDPDDRDLHHEARGARWLARLFGPTVTAPIALHVTAKRYLCAVDPAYGATLSDGSRRSLARQGGPLSEEEVARFRAHRSHTDAVRLRWWDDGGKRTDGIAVAPLDSYRPLLERLARA